MNLIYYVQPYGFFAVSLKRDGRAPLGVAGVFAFMFELPTQPLSLLHRAPSKTCTIAIAVGVTTTIISGGLLRMTYCHLKGPATPRHVIPDQPNRGHQRPPLLCGVRLASCDCEGV